MKSMTKSSRIVFAHRGDLLGSLLLNLANAWRFADRIGAELICVWPTHLKKRAPIRLRDIYEIPEGNIPFQLIDDVRDARLHDALRVLSRLVTKEILALGFEEELLRDATYINYDVTGPIFPAVTNCEQPRLKRERSCNRWCTPNRSRNHSPN